jgi:hypothetical protein
MSILRSSIGVGGASERSGKVGGRALTEDDDGVSDLSRTSDFGKPFADIEPAVCDADLADARSWLLTGGLCGMCLWLGRVQGVCASMC